MKKIRIMEGRKMGVTVSTEYIHTFVYLEKMRTLKASTSGCIATMDMATNS